MDWFLSNVVPIAFRVTDGQTSDAGKLHRLGSQSELSELVLYRRVFAGLNFLGKATSGNNVFRW